jgi:hypothetical protein
VDGCGRKLKGIDGEDDLFCSIWRGVVEGVLDDDDFCISLVLIGS